MYGKPKNTTVPSDSQAREKYVLILYQRNRIHQNNEINNQKSQRLNKIKIIENHISTTNIFVCEIECTYMRCKSLKSVRFVYAAFSPSSSSSSFPLLHSNLCLSLDNFFSVPMFRLQNYSSKKKRRRNVLYSFGCR